MSFHTGPGLPPQVITAGDLTITKMSVGDMDNNVYLIKHRLGDSVIIDAADEAPRVAELGAGTNVRAIITTHEHADHSRALKVAAQVFKDAEILTAPAATKALPIPAKKVKIGKPQSFGKLELTFISLRGHTKEGIAVVASSHGETHIFTGDSLFPGGIGKTDSPQAYHLLFNDVRDRIFAEFDDATHIHPGHGDSTTLGDERPHLDEWEKKA